MYKLWNFDFLRQILQSFGSESRVAKAVDVEVPSNSMKSIVGNNLSISNLPPEDLVIIMNGGGSRRIASNYGDIVSQPSAAELKLVVDSTNNRKVEIFDATTNHSIATRLIPDNGIISAVDKSLKFTGETSSKDIFNISNTVYPICK